MKRIFSLEKMIEVEKQRIAQRYLDEEEELRRLWAENDGHEVVGDKVDGCWVLPAWVIEVDE